MSNTRYIEFDSTYRNRNEWPLPGEFEVLISQTGRKGKDDAVDPVSDSANITRWTSNEFNITGPAASITGTIDGTTTTPAVIGSTTAEQVIIVAFGAGNDAQKIENYYSNSVLEVTTTTPVERRRIISSKVLSQSPLKLEFVVKTSFSSAVNTGATIKITDPTDLADTSNPLFFVPNGLIGSNRYTNCLLYNETKSLSTLNTEYRPITSYNEHTHIVTLDASNLVPVTGWTSTDVFSIRKSLPVLGQANNNISSTNVVSLPISFSSEQDYYRNSWITIPSTQETRRIVRYETYSGNFRSVTSSTVMQFPSNASTVSGYYNDAYIQVLSGNATGEIRKVISYDGNTKTVTLDNTIPIPTPNIGDQFTFRSLYITPDFSTPVLKDKFEILYFSNDNLNPFIYSGSQVSQQEMVCYEIQLLNICLPNKILSTGSGSRITCYPYVYVEISNISGSSAGMKNVIYSNNPNSTRMIFRTTVGTRSVSGCSPFVKLTGDGMIQTLKFKPNDNLRFSVRLPNGELYQTVELENEAPLSPNSEIQISCLFSIKRL